MYPLPKLEIAELIQLAHRSAQVSTECACARASFLCWESIPVSFPESQLQDVGTLMENPFEEPTFVEFHPAGTRYESSNAPIAPRYFPYNRCTISKCLVCERHFLRYTEAGGYFVDKRIRALNPELIVDASI
ncbi:hypothetical protein [Collimonas sp. OK607]|uniref:hypothetical protein n=1 Tax=Collimonas sp. OK607 TaxID=1798194 RepID=UPI000B8683D1|nr:hypothetical protein [Collimonas sp. OK607]